MHILIIGASGRTGKLILAAALKRSHTVTALVRTPSSLEPQAGLTIISGTPLNTDDISSAFTAAPTPPGAVIIALNSQRATDNPFAAPIAPPELMVQSTRNVVAAMRQYGTRRLVTLSSFGIGESIASVFLPVRWLMGYSNMKVNRRDHEMVEAFMRGEGKEGGIEWVGVKPARLTDGGEAPVKVFGERGDGVATMPSISRASVAGWLVDCVEDGAWVGKTPVIAS